MHIIQFTWWHGVKDEVKYQWSLLIQLSKNLQHSLEPSHIFKQNLHWRPLQFEILGAMFEYCNIMQIKVNGIEYPWIHLMVALIIDLHLTSLSHHHNLLLIVKSTETKFLVAELIWWICEFLTSTNFTTSHSHRYTSSLDYCTAYSAPLPIVDCVGLDFVGLDGMI